MYVCSIAAAASICGYVSYVLWTELTVLLRGFVGNSCIIAMTMNEPVWTVGGYCCK